MRLSLGFNTSYPSSINDKYCKENVVYINTYFLIKRYSSSPDSIRLHLKELINNLGAYSYITTNSSLHLEIINDKVGLKSLTQNEVDLLKFIITEVYILCAEFNKVDYIYEKFPLPDFSKNNLYVRYGNVELRVIENFIRGELTPAIVECVMNEAYLDGEFFDLPMKQDLSKWLSASDVRYNLRALMHTAGFYFPLTGSIDSTNVGWEDLNLWAKKYLNGLSIGSLFSYPGCYPFFFNVLKYLIENTSFNSNLLNFPSPQLFFEMLEGKTVLIVTPFKALMDRMINEERLMNLYKDFKISNIKFITIQAPFSIYPTRADESWGITYHKLLSEIENIFEAINIDIFMASCGCYGLPITTDVYEKYGCCSVYYGNYLNTLFGIRQACSSEFMAGNINEHLRLNSDLSKYPNLSRVDNGRYI